MKYLNSKRLMKYYLIMKYLYLIMKYYLILINASDNYKLIIYVKDLVSSQLFIYLFNRIKK